MKIYPVIRKVVVAAATGANFRTPVTPGVVLKTVLTARQSAQVGIAVRQSLTARTAVKAGLAVSARASGTARSPVRPALLLRNLLTARQTARAAARIVQIRYDLTRRPTSTVTQAAIGGRSDWQNPTNAAGARNGTTATLSSAALNATGGELAFSYPVSSGKSQLTITSVKLVVAWKQAGTLALTPNGTLKLQWAKGGARTTLATKTLDFDALTTPDTYDLTGQVTTWAEVDALQAFVSASYAAATVGIVDSVDAVEIVITASLTDLNT